LNATLSINHRSQQTIAGAASVSGFGYWSGEDVTVEFRPALPNSGIVFVRHDLAEPKRIPARVEHRIEIPRRTTLVAEGATVEMVEHVLAALAGLAIDNCEVWVDRPEMPGCDGSSLPFVEAILAAGMCEQHEPRAWLAVTEAVRVGDENCWIEARPNSGSGLAIKYRLDYGSGNPIGRQTLHYQHRREAFAEQLAPARTFLLQEEAEWLRQQGLGTRVTCQDVIVFDDEGPRDNELRFEDECVRHKTLDLIGDLALAGCDLNASIIACRTGHRLNAELVRVLLSEGQVIERLGKTG
jgi:UDP-3-O-acyl N-acetylglucosamine deacetylase